MLTRPYKDRLAVCFIVIAAVLSGYFSFFVHPPKELLYNDGVKKWEERMKPVRQYLPPSIREVGYVSDSDSTAVFQEYSLTQFALAPVVVRQGVEYEWIIGNFTQPGFESILGEKIPSDFTIKKFGAGIYLIHRASL